MVLSAKRCFIQIMKGSGRPKQGTIRPWNSSSQSQLTLNRWSVHLMWPDRHLILWPWRPFRVKWTTGLHLPLAVNHLHACAWSPSHVCWWRVLQALTGSHSLVFSLGNQEPLLPPCRNGYSAESGKVHKSQVSFLSSFFFLLAPFDLFWGNVILFCI